MKKPTLRMLSPQDLATVRGGAPTLPLPPPAALAVLALSGFKPGNPD